MNRSILGVYWEYTGEYTGEYTEEYTEEYTGSILGSILRSILRSILGCTKFYDLGHAVLGEHIVCNP